MNDLLLALAAVAVIVAVYLVAQARARPGGALRAGSSGGEIDLTFTDYPVDVYTPAVPQHTAKVCDRVQAVVTLKPPLGPNERTTIEVKGFGAMPLPTAELGTLPTHPSKITLDADATGKLVFGFHITSGRPPGYIEMTVTRADGTVTKAMVIYIIV